MSFAGPLLGEAIGLIGKYVAANQADKAAIELRKAAAIAEMKGAREDERIRHDAETAETQRVIDEAAKTQP